MKQKAFLVLAILGIIFVSGCVQNINKTTTSGVVVNVPKQASVNGPLDTALAEVTILSEQGNLTKIRIEKIKDYKRYPKATYPSLNVGDEVLVRVYSFASEEGNSGTAGAVRGNEPPAINPQKQPVIGEKYLADMRLCINDYIGGLSCGTDGWSVALYPIQPSPPPVTPGGQGADITPPSTTSNR